MIELDDAAEDRGTQASLEITVRVEADGRHWLRSLVAVLGIARLRASFQAPHPLDRVLRPAPAAEIEALCREAAPEDGVLSLPDHEMSFAGLVIRGLVIFAHRAADGVRQIVIRARRMAGNALALFRTEVIPADALALRYEQLASLAVERFFLPIANLNHLLDEVIATGDREGQHRVLASLERLRAQTVALQASFSQFVTEISGLPRLGSEEETRRLVGLPG